MIIKSEVSTYPLLSCFSVVVCLKCLSHHILSLIVYTFWENRNFVFIIIGQFMMSANSQIRFGFVCLYITLSHYHHCANWSEDIEFIKWLSDIFFECVSKINSPNYPLYNTWVCVFQFTNFPCDDWENIHFVLLSSSNQNYYPLFRARS